MSFASVTFVFFFLPAAIGLYFAAPTLRLKSATLLALSTAFYAWGEPRFAAAVALSVAFNFAAAKVIDRQGGGLRRLALALAVAVNLSGLVLFKYADFLLGGLAAATGAALPTLGLPLPLGVSFLTFHALSYLIDVARGQQRANARPSEVALYLLFFPQLVAGPITRYRRLAPQLRVRRHTLGRASTGLRIFIVGLAQKVLIADELALLPDTVFGTDRAPGLVDAWVAAAGYALQIYFDFAGYSNMAIGLGLIFGFRLPRNFRRPYAARSLTAFWRRWHITLSQWFRDYLYVPLGGDRHGAGRTYRNLIVVFVLCGLWHGANWTFLIWGLLHGAVLIGERLARGRGLAWAPLGHAYLLMVVVVTWVMFRADTPADALRVWRGMLGLTATAPADLLAPVFRPWHGVLLVAGLALATCRPGPMLKRWALGGVPRRALLEVGHAVGGTALLAWATLSIAGQVYRPFLYFRF